MGLLINDRILYDEVVAAARDIQLLSDQMGDVFVAVKEGKGALGTLLYDKTAADQVKRSIDNIAEFSDKLNSDRSTIGRLVSSDALYRQAEDVLNRVDAAVDSVSNAGPITAVGVAAAALF